MPKLTTIKPLVSKIRPALAPTWDDEPGKTWQREGSGRGGRPWRRKRDAAMRRDDYLCQHCKAKGRLTPATEVHHIIGKAEGGDDDEANLISLCHECHDAVEASKRVNRRRE